MGGDKSASGRVTTNTPDKFYAAALQNKNEDGISPIEYWSDLAYAIFANNAKETVVDKSISGFGSDYTGSEAYYGDIAKMLAGSAQGGSTNGSSGIGSTGLQTASSMSAVRDKAFDLVSDDISRNSVTGSKLKGSITDGNCLDDLDDTKSDSNVLYTMVHSMEHKGTYRYFYTVFGLAFYDFQLQIIANDDLSYITAAEGYSSVEDAYNNGVSGALYTTTSDSSDVLSYYTNGSKEEADVGMEFEQSNSLTVSNTIETQESYTYSSMIGSETKIGGSFMDFGSVEETLKLEFTAEEALSTAYSDTTEKTKETSSTISASMTLPAQSAVAIESYSNDTDMILDYDCPVAITYKVKMFAMSGEVYAYKYDYYVNTTDYEHCYFTTTFGGSNAVSGTDAVTNLYNRAIVFGENADDSAYGSTYGYYKKSKDGKAATEVYSLCWPEILEGTIHEEDLTPEEIEIYVNCLEVDANGEPVYDKDANGNIIYDEEVSEDETTKIEIPRQHSLRNTKYGEPVYKNYVNSINASSTINIDGKDYILYTEPIYDDDGVNINDLTGDATSGYKMQFVPDAEHFTAELFYYDPTTASTPTSAQPYSVAADTADEDVAEVVPVETESTAAEETVPAAAEEPAETEASALEAQTEASVGAEEPAAVEELAETENLAVAEELSETETEAATDAEESAEIEETEEPAEVEEDTEAEAVTEAEETTEAEESAETADSDEDAEIAEYAYVEEDVAEEDDTEAASEPAESTEPAEDAEPVEVYEPETYDVIVEDGDLIGSVSNGGTVAGLSSTGSAEAPLTIESIEVVEEEDVPEEAANVEETEPAYGISVYTETPSTASVKPYAVAGTNDVIIWLCSHTPMSITGATFSASARAMYSDIFDIEPIYPLDTIKVTSDQTTFNMISGTTLNVDNIVVNGFNSNNVEYYGFNQDLGSWVITDVSGEEITDSEIASLETDPATGETLLTANEEGTVYLKYLIDEDEANYTYMSHDVSMTNNALSSTAMVKVNVSKGPFNGRVVAEGTLVGYAYDDESINLDTVDTIDVEVYDEKDKKIYDPVITWEAQKGEQDGIILENNRLYFTKAGTYNIRAVYGYSTVSDNPCSDWIEVTALPEKVLDVLTIEDQTDPALLSDIILGDGQETINLGLLTLTAVDQYENDWTKLENLKWYVRSEEEEEGEEVEPDANGSILYTATEAGTYYVYAQCADDDGKYDVKSNELELIVLPERELATLDIADEADPAILTDIILGDGYEDVNLSSLTLASFDQYGDEWSDLSDLTWYVGETEVEADADGTFIYTATGPVTDKVTYNVYATCDGVSSNELSLTVWEARKASSMQIADETLPATLADIILGDGYEDVNLSDLTLIVEDQYGDTWSDLSDLIWHVGETEVEADADGTFLYTATGPVTDNVTYNVYATCGEAESNKLSLTVLEARKASSMQIADETSSRTLADIILGDGYEDVKLGDLTLTALDQYGDTWSDFSDLIWYVGSTAVKAADGSVYTANTPGKYKVYAKCGEAESNELSLTVLEARKVVSLQIADETDPATLAKVMVGEGKEDVRLSALTITCKDQYGDDWTDFSGLIWYVDDAENGSDVYTARTAGTHSIYAVCGGVQSNELSVEVEIPVQSITLNKESLIIKDGKTKTLKATINPTDTTDTLTWSSSDESIAVVSEDGTITAVADGKVTITLTATSGVSASCSVTVAPVKGETFSKGSFSFSVKDSSTDGTGTVTITGFSKVKSKKTLNIGSTVTLNGISYKVTAIADGAFKGNTKIKTVKTGSNVKTIGKSAFEGCTNLKTVTISSSVEKVGFKSFYDCYALKNLTIGKNVTYLGAHCFCNDSKLKTITVKTTKLKKKNVKSPHVFINVNKATMKVPKSKYSSYKKIFTSRYFGGKITKSK